MTNADDPITLLCDNSEKNIVFTGLTKREYFAVMRSPAEGESSISKAQAELIMGSLAPVAWDINAMNWWIEAEAKMSVLQADALIKALNK